MESGQDANQHCITQTVIVSVLWKVLGYVCSMMLAAYSQMKAACYNETTKLRKMQGKSLLEWSICLFPGPRHSLTLVISSYLPWFPLLWVEFHTLWKLWFPHMTQCEWLRNNSLVSLPGPTIPMAHINFCLMMNVHSMSCYQGCWMPWKCCLETPVVL